MLELGNWYRAEGMYDEAISHYKVAYQLSGQKASIKEVLDETIAEKAQKIEEEQRLNENR